MARLLRTIPLMLALLAPLTLANAQAQGQQEAGDLKPRIAELGDDAFVPGPAGSDTAPGATVFETEPRQAVAFTDMLLRWQVDLPPGAAINVKVRTGSDGKTWSNWVAMTPSDDPPRFDEPPNAQWSDPLQTNVATWYQLHVELLPGLEGVQPLLHRIDVHTIDARIPGGKQPLPDVGPEKVANAVDRPAFVSRTGWGNPQGEGSPSAPPAYYTANHLVVHHTADANSLSSGTTWADRVRAIWSFHTYSRGWGDIGYNWLIDPNGVIYAGRAGSTDLSRDAVAFHDTANYGSMGVSLIGTYTSVSPSAATLTSLVEVLAWKAGQRGIDPNGSSYYYGCARSSYCAPFNNGAVTPNISGHRQITPGHTTCPGDVTMGLLPSIRQRVADRMGDVTPPPAPPQTVSAQLVSVKLLRSEIFAGEAVPVEFTIKNGPTAVQTQAPDASKANDLSSGWVYDEAECFAGPGNNSYPAYPKETGKLRVMLGVAGAGTPINCAGDAAGYPWRWGVGGPMAPNETRTINAYVRFRTPGSYTLRANLINEYVKTYGVDGNGAEAGVGTLVVHPENRPPDVSQFDATFSEHAAIYQLGPVPAGLLARSTSALSVPEGPFIGTFQWDGKSRDWGAQGPRGQADRFVIRQVRAFVAPVAGAYSFRLASDDGAWLWVDGVEVAAIPGLHGITAAENTVNLSAGVHTLSVKFFEYVGGAYSGYAWKPPGATSWSNVPFSSQGERVANLWKNATQMTLAASDFGESGLRELHYVYDGGSELVSSNGVATIGAGPGPHVVEYWAVDNTGNPSPRKQIQFIVDPNLQITRSWLGFASK